MKLRALACCTALIVVTGCGRQPLMSTDLLERLASTAFVAAEPAVDMRWKGNDAPPAAALGMVLEHGWWHTEKHGSWAVGRHAEVAVDLIEAAPRVLHMQCRPYPMSGSEQVQTMTVGVNGTEVAHLEMDRRQRRYRVAIPEGLLTAGGNSITLDFAFCRSPKELGRADDRRRLAASCSMMALLEPGTTTTLETELEPAMHAAPESTRVTWNRPGIAVLPFEAGAGRARLVLSATAGAGPASLRIGLMDARGDWQELFAVETDEAGGTLSAALPTGFEIPHAGHWFLTLDGRFGPGSRIVVQQARLEHRARPEPRPRRRRAPARRPDIVVLIPDALRPDHLGCYGYHRDTSPRIDRLADESILFPTATSLASYTVCSMPTLITGTSFLRHAVVDHKGRLADSMTTLAESLRAAGYATVAFSGNAYYSPTFGSDQGYDEFVAMWQEFPKEEQRSFDPHEMVEMAVQRLRRGFDHRPVFMLLHMVPPHAPYDPPPSFDIFSDPEYDGPARGDRDTIAEIVTGRLKLAPIDQLQLMNLYDGNLRRVDNAIGRLLNSLRKRSRWDDTVVLLVSDHGEAFFEHGVQGHVRTVYEEMLRVPFILRLPDHLRPREVTTKRLVTLADVTPTLLGLAGVAPQQPIDGIDLLAAKPPASDRLLFLRNGGDTRITYGVRIGSTKAIFHELRVRELYDLQTDPLELDNLARRHPMLMAGLGQLLDDALRTSNRAAADRIELDPDEAAALRALGYMN